MNKYLVTFNRYVTYEVEVEAETDEEARQLVENEDFETWQVSQVNQDDVDEIESCELIAQGAD